MKLALTVLLMLVNVMDKVVFQVMNVKINIVFIKSAGTEKHPDKLLCRGDPQL